MFTGSHTHAASAPWAAGCRHTPALRPPRTVPEARGLSPTYRRLHLQNQGTTGAQRPRLIGTGHAHFPTALVGPRPARLLRALGGHRSVAFLWDGPPSVPDVPTRLENIPSSVSPDWCSQVSHEGPCLLSAPCQCVRKPARPVCLAGRAANFYHSVRTASTRSLYHKVN